MENITNNPIIPEDLEFIWVKYNLNTIAQMFAEKYEQIFPKTALQEKLHKIGSVEHMTREKTLEWYAINNENLFSLYKKLEQNALLLGVTIEYTDMSTFAEDDYYENYIDDPNHVKHAETARSDGKTLLLELDLEKAGGITGRIYDLIHLAFGHMVQWSSENPSLLLTREEAWSIGYRNHEKSPDRVLDMMSFYEFEAGMYGIEAICQALDTTTIEQEQKDRILQYFVDYAYCDRAYIIQHYRGNHESFQKFWQFGKDIPPRRDLPEVREFIKRHAVEIGLIRDKKNETK